MPNLRTGETNPKAKTPELGDEVKCRITGFQGIVIAHATFVAGCERMIVQCQELKDGEIVEPQYFDKPNLEVVTKREFPVAPIEKTKFKLGDKARDTITGYEGTIVDKVETINGNVRFGILPSDLKDGKPRESISIYHNRLEAVKKKPLKKRRESEPPGGNQIPSRVL